ncbi:MAG: dihydrolipoamide acetyltransferase family protein, partial [Bdellovibrionota bacterium]
MAMEFRLPELGEGVHEGEMVKWRIAVGDVVKDDQPLCEIMTDKATIEIPSPFHGKVTTLAAKEGAVVKVGELLVTYEGQGKSAATSSAQAPSPAPAAAQMAAPPVAMTVSGAPDTSPATRVLAAPSTRKFARESGVDLSRVAPSGPNGRVMRDDIETFTRGIGATAAGKPVPAKTAFQPNSGSVKPPSAVALARGEERIPFRGLRKKIAEKMRQSKDHAAHFTYVEEADATQLVRLRNQAKELGAAQGVKVTYLPFIMKAMVAALRKHPSLNSSLDEAAGEIVVKHYFNIGLSIQTEDGLTAPVVKDVDRKSVLELAREIQDIVARARSKKLVLEDFHGGTITLTNAGSIGGLFATPVINFPEVAILGFNKIFRKPVVRRVRGREKVVIRD